MSSHSSERSFVAFVHTRVLPAAIFPTSGRPGTDADGGLDLDYQDCPERPERLDQLDRRYVLPFEILSSRLEHLEYYAKLA
jgi:hypothetical protein